MRSRALSVLLAASLVLAFGVNQVSSLPQPPIGGGGGGGAPAPSPSPTPTPTPTPTASIGASGGTVTTSIATGSGAQQAITMSIPSGAVSSTTTFSISGVLVAPDPTISVDGEFFLIQATAIQGGSAITRFSEPIAITIPPSTQSDAALFWSPSPTSPFVALSLCANPPLSDGADECYSINANGTRTIYTNHFTFFGWRKIQRALVISTSALTVQLNETATLTTSGGDGTGAIRYTSRSANTCSVTSAGVVVGRSAGVCQIAVSKLSSGLFGSRDGSIFLTVSDSVARSEAEAKAKAEAEAKRFPSSISAPRKGLPILKAVSVSTSGFVAVVPRATVNNRVALLTLRAIPLSNQNPALAANKTIDPTSLSRKPIQLSKGVVLGGIAASDLLNAPVATVSKTNIEVQMAQDVPTRIRFINLNKRALASLRYFAPSGNILPLGEIRVDRSGQVTLPPITLLSKGIKATLQIVVDGKITSISIRSVR